MIIVKPPPRELRRLAVRIDSGIGIYLKDRDNQRMLTSPWEAVRHAWTLSNLVIRHTEATALMARSDAVLAPAAFITARAAIETAARVVWLLEPQDVWEREGRWIALLREGARFGERHQLADDPHFARESSKLHEFARAVEAKLPPHVSIPRTPSADAMFTSDGKGLSAFYVVASQYAHGAELATRNYRTHLGGSAEYGEVGEIGDWLVPLTHAWSATRACLTRLMQVSGAKWSPALDEVDRQITDAIQQFEASLAAPPDR